MNVSNKVAVFRKEHFNAAHRIFNPAWDDKKNFEVFGKCSNPHYHGHNYELIVKVVGEPDPDTGYVMDMKKLSVIVKEEVLERFDHKNLNLDTEQFRNLNPTAENIVKVTRIAVFRVILPLKEGSYKWSGGKGVTE